MGRSALIRLVALAAISTLVVACGTGGPVPNEPAAPSNVQATAGPGFVSLSWQHGGQNVTGFAVHRSLATIQLQESLIEPAQTGMVQIATLPANARNYQDFDVLTDTAYFYAVSARGSGNASSALVSPPGNEPVIPLPPGEFGFCTDLSEVIEIEDQYLRTLLYGVLGLSEIEDDITCADMRSLTTLTISNTNTVSLSGLQHAQELTQLLSGGLPTKVTDLSPLVSLAKLETLQLRSSTLASLQPLATMTGLNKLLLSGTFSNLAPLASLVALEDLELNSGNMTELTSLSGLNGLTRLHLVGAFGNLNPVSGLQNLSYLHLQSSGLSNLAPLSQMTWLQALNLSGSGSQITDITPLAGLVNLTQLVISTSLSFSSIEALSGLVNLTQLSVTGRDIVDISPLGGMTGLQRLTMVDNKIKDISVLSGLSSLQRVDLFQNAINDLSPLVANANFTGSQARLDIRHNCLELTSEAALITQLQSRGVTVVYEPQRPCD